MGLRKQHRQHVAEGLRQHHELYALRVGHAHRIAGEHLALGHALDAGARDLGVVSEVASKTLKVMMADSSAPIGRPIKGGMSRKNHRITTTSGIERSAFT